MDRRFMGILAAIIIIFIGVFAVAKNSNTSSSTTNTKGAATTNHVQGLNQKHVTLVEYGDYECPVCGAYYPTVQQVAAQFNNDIAFQFRNLPLFSIHPNAFAAARAAEAAGLQGKYFEMHDKLYENQDPSGQSGWVASRTPLDYFSNFAQQIGLDITKFKADYASSKVNDAINADLAAFNKTGQEMATPTFFINGKYVPNQDLSDNNGPSAAKFAAVINNEIKNTNQ
jgi:protein-disulfide isomerase